MKVWEEYCQKIRHQMLATRKRYVKKNAGKDGQGLKENLEKLLVCFLMVWEKQILNIGEDLTTRANFFLPFHIPFFTIHFSL